MYEARVWLELVQDSISKQGVVWCWCGREAVKTSKEQSGSAPVYVLSLRRDGMDYDRDCKCLGAGLELWSTARSTPRFFCRQLQANLLLLRRAGRPSPCQALLRSCPSHRVCLLTDALQLEDLTTSARSAHTRLAVFLGTPSPVNHYDRDRVTDRPVHERHHRWRHRDSPPRRQPESQEP